MSPRLSSVLGAFRILRKRSHEVGRPGLAVWADAGERAAVAMQAKVRDESHRAEIGALSLEQELKEIIADGQITADEQRRLMMMPARLHRVAEQAHEVSEVVS